MVNTHIIWQNTLQVQMKSGDIMGRVSIKAWFTITIFFVFTACAISPVTSSELIELHNSDQNEISWIEYGDGVNIIIWVENFITNERKANILYTLPEFFPSLSDFQESFENIVNEYNDVVADTGKSLTEMVQYANVERVPWMGTWTPDAGYNYHIVE